MPFLLRSSSWLAVAASLLAGCSVSADAPRPAAQQAQPEPASAEAPVAVAEPAKAEPLRTTKPSDTPAGPLTEEELALIAADPADLTVEQRRQRAYARRKQIMQNPDSPTARALKDLAEAHGIPCIAFKYAENSAQFQQFREQVSQAAQAFDDEAIETQTIPREFHDPIKAYFGNLDKQTRIESADKPAEEKKPESGN